MSTRKMDLSGPSYCPVRHSYNTVLNLRDSRKLDNFLASRWPLTFARKLLLCGIIWLIGRSIKVYRRNVIIE